MARSARRELSLGCDYFGEGGGSGLESEATADGVGW
jgi:hypothetical protein